MILGNKVCSSQYLQATQSKVDQIWIKEANKRIEEVVKNQAGAARVMLEQVYLKIANTYMI